MSYSNKKRLIISDMHFGSGDDLLRFPMIIERLEEHLDWADEIIINGDMFELVFSSLYEAIKSSKPFLKQINDRVDKIIFLPGNHDYHLVTINTDQRRIAHITNNEVEYEKSVKGPGQELLQHLLPDCQIQTFYPTVEIDNNVYTHGHYLTQHINTMGWRAMDKLQWRLTGEERKKNNLTVNDYEALLAPLYELMYQIAQLPAGRKGQIQNERLIAMAGAVMRTPFQIGKQITSLTKSTAQKFGQGKTPEPSLVPPISLSAALEAISHVANNLSLPAGNIIFAHTHEAFTNMTHPYAPDNIFFNSGSWIYDHRNLKNPYYKDTQWPGTILKCDEKNNITLHKCLEDLTIKDIEKLLK